MIKQEIFNIIYDKDSLLDNYGSIIENLKRKIRQNNPYYKVLSTQDSANVLEPLIDISEEILANFKDVVIISIGGSYLNPRSFIDFMDLGTGNSRDREEDKKINIHFLSRTEPDSILNKLKGLDLSKTAILTISKSGNTLEIVSILGVVMNMFKNSGLEEYLFKNFYFISNHNSAIGRVAKKLKSKFIEHDQDISGRYSGASSVSILPALLNGIDVEEYLLGINEELKNFDSSNLHDAVLYALILDNTSRNVIVNIGYAERLKMFLDWNAQIMAESLGKKGTGFTPVTSICPEDQHSMFQLYIEGPDDKFYNYYYFASDLNYLDHSDKNYENLQIYEDPEILGKLSGMNISKIHKINQEASFETLKSINRPLRRIIIDEPDARNFGSLVAFSMIETIALGEIRGINPFNQEGVELIKIKTRAATEF